MSAGPGASGYFDILVKSLLGGLLIAVLLTLARLRHYIITGLLVSIPAVSLYTWWWIGKEQGTGALRISVRTAMLSAIPWVAYLGIVYLLAGRVSLWLALALGWLAWFLIALVFFLLLQPRA